MMQRSGLLLIVLFLIQDSQGQDIGSLFSSFLGGGGGAGGAGGGAAPFQNILQGFMGGGGGGGGGQPFSQFLQLGQQFLKPAGGGLGLPPQGPSPFVPQPGPPPGPQPGAAPTPTASDYDDDIDPALTQIKARDVPSYTPIGRSVPKQINHRYYRPNARTFVQGQARPPPVRAHAIRPVNHGPPPTTPSPIHHALNWAKKGLELLKQPPRNTQQAGATVAPFTLFPPASPPPTLAPVPTLPPPNLPKGNPKLFAHNTVNMIKEIASLSDVHQGQNDDYGSVQTLMEAFFEYMSDGVQKSPEQIRPLADGTEMGPNRPLTNQLFESDMVLTVEQMKGVVLAAKERRMGQRRVKRKVITGGVYRWPRAPIPYRFKSGTTDEWKNTIRSALKMWEGETCVRWAENKAGKDNVIFFRGSGCYSSVGRTGGQQAISIGYGCESTGIVAHEVGHSLGFWHEQSRPDRDQYINIRKDWILKGTAGNFELRTTKEIDDMGLPYDMGSIMHYGSQAFTKDWDQNTIQTKDQNYQRTIGQRKSVSFIDVKQVNRLYCNDICALSPLRCVNGGYPNPNNCQRCKCPPGLGGNLCQQPESTPGCGGELVASPLWQELGHKGKRRCVWRIKTHNARISLVLSDVKMRCETTCAAFVEVKANSDFQQTGFRACCEGKVKVKSEQSEVIIIADSTALDYETSFSIRYIQDSGQPLPKPPPAIWIPGKENRGFRGAANTGGPVERFILQVIPKIRDTNRPFESIASIVTHYSVASLLGIAQNGGK